MSENMGKNEEVTKEKKVRKKRLREQSLCEKKDYRFSGAKTALHLSQQGDEIEKEKTRTRGKKSLRTEHENFRKGGMKEEGKERSGISRRSHGESSKDF